MNRKQRREFNKIVQKKIQSKAKDFPKFEVGGFLEIVRKTPIMETTEYKDISDLAAIGVLEKGDKIEMTAIHHDKTGIHKPWYEVKFENKRGWINGIALLGS